MNKAQIKSLLKTQLHSNQSLTTSKAFGNIESSTTAKLKIAKIEND
jgi:hypothetical protein